MKEVPTKVIFRIDKHEVIALFPEISETHYLCSCYVHYGQHSAADPQHIIATSRPATELEYAALAGELEGIGYVLDIKKRISPKMRRAFQNSRITREDQSGMAL